jgi:hypothetical protein
MKIMKNMKIFFSFLHALHGKKCCKYLQIFKLMTSYSNLFGISFKPLLGAIQSRALWTRMFTLNTKGGITNGL